MRTTYRPFRQLPTLFFGAMLLVAGQTEAQAREGASICDAAAQYIPARPVDARSASAFFDAIAAVDERERDRMIRGELIAGNMPGFLRNLQPLSLLARLPGGAAMRLTLCVMVDYLSIGSDRDFVLIPMGLDTAIAVANQFGFTLPTPHMVDLIYGHAGAYLTPQPLPAGDQMRSSIYYRLHDAMVKQQRETAGFDQDMLTAGHKKDLVLSTKLWNKPDRVAIYGWQRQSGVPIQSLSTVHGFHYADYSHGVRLVSNVVFVDGVARAIDEVWGDKHLAPLLSSEGILPTLSQWVERSDRHTAAGG